MNVRALIRNAIPRQAIWRFGHARLGYWNERNFGDLYSPKVITTLFGVKTQYSGFGAADLVAVGSLLELVQERAKEQTPLIWGSGFIRDGGPWTGPNADFRAVRGKLSLGRVKNRASSPIALGDPGVLVDRVYPHLAHAPKRFSLSVVPHFHEMDHEDVVALRDTHVHIIDPRDNPSNVASQLAASEFVISSSLHGLIFSDGLGVPNVWAPISESLTGGSYKFRDYYSVYDIDPKPQTLKAALDSHEDLRSSWTSRPGIAQLKESLVQAFPLPAKKG